MYISHIHVYGYGTVCFERSTQLVCSFPEAWTSYIQRSNEELARPVTAGLYTDEQ